jgi:hypothetical protein
MALPASNDVEFANTACCCLLQLSLMSIVRCSMHATASGAMSFLAKTLLWRAAAYVCESSFE